MNTGITVTFSEMRDTLFEQKDDILLTGLKPGMTGFLQLADPDCRILFAQLILAALSHATRVCYATEQSFHKVRTMFSGVIKEIGIPEKKSLRSGKKQTALDDRLLIHASGDISDPGLAPSWAKASLIIMDMVGELSKSGREFYTSMSKIAVRHACPVLIVYDGAMDESWSDFVTRCDWAGVMTGDFQRIFLNIWRQTFGEAKEEEFYRKGAVFMRGKREEEENP